jgi:hypothetical protein
MPVIRCLNPINGDRSTYWKSGFAVLSAYYCAILLYCVVPIIIHRAAFVRLSLLNRATRIGYAVSMSLKTLGDIGVNIVGHFGGAGSRWGVWGLFLLEFPCYVITTSYSLVLIFWLSVCTQLLPARYVRAFRVMKTVLIIFNVLAHLLFVLTVVIEWDVPISTPWLVQVFYGFAAIGRDFLLGAIFIGFIVVLKLSLRDDASAGETLDERKLLCSTGMLSGFMLLRGGLSLLQGLVFASAASECELGFFVILMVSEILFDGLPFISLISTSNDFVLDVNDQRAQFDDRFSEPETFNELIV